MRDEAAAFDAENKVGRGLGIPGFEARWTLQRVVGPIDLDGIKEAAGVLELRNMRPWVLPDRIIATAVLDAPSVAARRIGLRSGRRQVTKKKPRWFPSAACGRWLAVD